MARVGENTVEATKTLLVAGAFIIIGPMRVDIWISPGLDNQLRCMQCAYVAVPAHQASVRCFSCSAVPLRGATNARVMSQDLIWCSAWVA